METVQLTTTQAIVRYLIAQGIIVDDTEEPLFPGVFAIFGHGNVICLGHALEQAKNELPTWRETVAVPEVSGRQSVLDARAALDQARADQRVGW